MTLAHRFILAAIAVLTLGACAPQRFNAEGVVWTRPEGVAPVASEVLSNVAKAEPHYKLGDSVITIDEERIAYIQTYCRWQMLGFLMLSTSHCMAQVLEAKFESDAEGQLVSVAYRVIAEKDKPFRSVSEVQWWLERCLPHLRASVEQFAGPSAGPITIPTVRLVSRSSAPSKQ